MRSASSGDPGIAGGPRPGYLSPVGNDTRGQYRETLDSDAPLRACSHAVLVRGPRSTAHSSEVHRSRSDAELSVVPPNGVGYLFALSLDSCPGPAPGGLCRAPQRDESASLRKDASWPPPAPLALPTRLHAQSADTGRVSFAKISEPLEVPDLLALQSDSFDWLIGSDRWQAYVAEPSHRVAPTSPRSPGLEEIFEEISPIEDFSGTMSLSFRDHRFEPPKNTVDECKERDFTYSAPLFVTAEFMNNETGEIKSQTVFMGDFPLMTEHGTFIVNGTERVVVSQLVRSPGRLLRAQHRQDLRQGRLHRQDHPVARRLARVRDRQARHGRRPPRPQAQAERHRAAQGARLDRGARSSRSSASTSRSG